MFKSEYDQIIRENFDLSDRTTRQYIATLEDAGQEQLLSVLSSALYDKIVSRVDDIDFGTIPMSRGDITKVEGFSKTEECISIIRNLILEYKQDTAIIDVVISTIQNIKDRKSSFIKGYSLNIEFPMLMYNLMVLSVERSVSLLISTCIQYVKDPTDNVLKRSFDKVAYKKTMDDLLFKQLINFNNMCKDGSFDKIMDNVMKHPAVKKEDVEMQYGTMTPISEDEPEVPVVDPFTGEPTNDTSDTTSGPNDFPEYHVDEPDIKNDYLEPDNDTPEVNVPDASYAEEDDEIPEQDETPSEPADDVDDTQTAPDEIENDTVDDENIPTVVPGDDVTDSNDAINEFAITTAALLAPAAIAGIHALLHPKQAIKLLVNIVRGTVYAFYYSKAKFSDFLDVQADLIEANANDLQYSTVTEVKDKEKTIKKQLKTVEKLRKWANIFSIDSKKSNNQAEKDMDYEYRNKKTVAQDNYGDYSIIF